jgi:hypothetical protein
LRTIVRVSPLPARSEQHRAPERLEARRAVSRCRSEVDRLRRQSRERNRLHHRQLRRPALEQRRIDGVEVDVVVRARFHGQRIADVVLDFERVQNARPAFDRDVHFL